MFPLPSYIFYTVHNNNYNNNNNNAVIPHMQSININMDTKKNCSKHTVERQSLKKRREVMETNKEIWKGWNSYIKSKRLRGWIQFFTNILRLGYCCENIRTMKNWQMFKSMARGCELGQKPLSLTFNLNHIALADALISSNRGFALSYSVVWYTMLSVSPCVTEEQCSSNKLLKCVGHGWINFHLK